MPESQRVNASSVKAVLTVPYVPVFPDESRTQQRGDSAVQAFARALRLALGLVRHSDVLVLLEEKIPNQIATHGIQSLVLAQNCEILFCDEFETTGRWYRGIRKAFTQGYEKVLVLPGDIEKVADLEKFQRGLKRMVTDSAPNCLTIGDYTSTDPFKEKFDSLCSHPFLKQMFPSAWAPIEATGIRKMRSEYFCIGSKAFRAFQSQPWRWIPLDVTMLLMLATVSEPTCKLKRVDLGQVTDLPTRRIEEATQQILRFGFQLWFNGHSRAAASVGAQTRLLTEEWWPLIREAMTDLLALIEPSA